MKKITLLLAMLLCLVPVLGACGGAGNPEAAVSAWLDAKYADGDAKVEDVYAVKLNLNLDVLDLIENETEASDLEKAVRSNREGTKDKINTMEDMDEKLEDNKWDDYDFNYEIIFCDKYDDDSDTFEEAKKDFLYKGTAIEDELTAVARVGVLMTGTIEKDGETMTNADVEVFELYCIDGNWYIG
jgi:hypothetical protein